MCRNAAVPAWCWHQEQGGVTPFLALQSLEETERLVAEGQGLPPPEIPLSTLPDHHLGDGLLGGLLDEVTTLTDDACTLARHCTAWH